MGVVATPWCGDDPEQETVNLQVGRAERHLKTHRRKKANKTKTKRAKTSHLPERAIHENASGIDVGSEELVAAVRPDRDAEGDPVRTFSSFTGGLHELRDWLLECRVDTVAIESTGNYWIVPAPILEEGGIEVHLCNARHVKGVPGRKTDICDTQWLQHLHGGRTAPGLVPARAERTATSGPAAAA